MPSRRNSWRAIEVRRSGADRPGVLYQFVSKRVRRNTHAYLFLDTAIKPCTRASRKSRQKHFFVFVIIISVRLQVNVIICVGNFFSKRLRKFRKVAPICAVGNPSSVTISMRGHGRSIALSLSWAMITIPTQLRQSDPCN
jgi:hypothetical protein